MLSAILSRNLSCENEAKFMQDRIAAVERTTVELIHVFGDYNRKAASIRDKTDEIQKAMLIFSDNETINKTLSVETANFADSMGTISAYGDLRVNGINTKVVDVLKEYEIICKRAKDEVKVTYGVREKEIAKKKALDRLRDRSPRNKHVIAKTDLVKASAEVARTIHNLEEQIVTFERQKLDDFKTILLDFISIEMGYHARAIEVLTKAYNHINNVDENSDLNEFKQSLHLPETVPVTGIRSLFRQSQSLGSLSTISTGKQPTVKASRNSPGIIKHNLGIPKPNQETAGIQKARSQDDFQNKNPKHKKEMYYDSETVSETETSEQQSAKSDVSPFLAKHFTK